MAIFSRFIPDSLSSAPVRSRLRERLAEAGGLGLWGLALCLAIALWSYDPRDPSANTSSAQPPANLMGRPGAYMADLMLQDFGIVGVVAILCLLAWGWRLVRHHGLASALLRFIALLCGLPVIAADIAALPLLVPGIPAWLWPTGAGLGGAVGLSVAHLSIQAATGFIGRGGPLIVWVLGLVLGGLLLLLAFALSLSEWKGIGRAIRFVLRQPVVVVRWLRHLAGQARDTTLPPAESGYSPRPPAPDHSSPLSAALASALEPRAPMGGEAEPSVAPVADADTVPAHTSTPGTAMMPVTEAPASKPVPPPAVKSMPAMAKPPEEAPRPALGGRPAKVSLQTSWMHPPGMDEEITQPLLGGNPLPSDRLPWHEDPTPAGSDPIALPAREDLPAAVTEPARPTLLSRFFSGGRATPEPEPTSVAEGYAPPPTAMAEEAEYIPSPQPQWQFPPLSLLRPPPENAATKPTDELLQANAAHLVTVLSEYGVQGEIVAYHAGPVVTLYELQPAPASAPRAWSALRMTWRAPCPC